MESNKDYGVKSHNKDPFGGMSKKRTTHQHTGEIFRSMSSKADLYKHLD